jgi:arylformamidase
MVFDIDFNAYKLVDLSLEVVPNQTVEGRPFEVKEGRLGDGTLKYDIVNTHTHVGTHIESPYHFYFKGKSCTDYPLDHFMGKATLLTTDIAECTPRVTLDFVKEQLEPRRGSFDILFVRNDTPRHPLFFDLECVPYFAELNLKLFVFDSTINFGEGLEAGRTFHDLLLSRDTLLVEFPDGAQNLERDSFYLFAVPLKIKGIDSSGCRLFAIVER